MKAPSPLLIRNATLLDGRPVDVRIEGGRIAAIGAGLDAPDAIEAGGGLLIPGLHDHHLHLAATAVARSSVMCGPPEVTDRNALACTLDRPGEGWLRGIGYYESVAGMLDRAMLDRVAPDRPVRIQHRGGRMWFFNSAGLDRLLASRLAPPDGLDQTTGQLFDGDAWLRAAIGGAPPALDDIGAALARMGVTGVTDMGPANGPAEHRWLSGEQARGALPQRVMIAGTAGLAALEHDARLMLGPVKIHLHEADLPDHDHLIATIVAAHEQDRGAAVHCVTEVELVFTLAALRAAGTHPGDRIEHAAVAPDPLVAEIAALGLPVVAQPLFVRARGDAYRRDIAPDEWPHLYRLRGFIDAGVALAGSSDAPYVDIDPWAAMVAAMDRRTAGGAVLGVDEALSPEQALALYLADPQDVRRRRAIAVGAPADLCLLDRPWAQARVAPSAVHVRLTVIGGDIVYQAPA